MAIIRPFKGIRPAPHLAAQVAALPYDVMSSEEAREMAKGNPHSFLRVDKAEVDLDEDIDLYDNRVYQKARENLDKMRREGVLIQDETPAFYIYQLEMNGRLQTGLVVCTSIDEYQNNTIKKHERTREDKELDRIRHVDICNANTGPIFTTYRAEASIRSMLLDFTEEHAPIYDFIAEDGIGHRAWMIAEAEVIAALVKAFAAVPYLYIADGHHRTASAAKVGLKRRAENPNYDQEANFNFYLSVLFPHDELCIMDYNRLVKDLNNRNKEAFLAQIEERFIVEKTAKSSPTKRHEFTMYLDGQWYKLEAKPESIPADSVKSLDVSILQEELLGPILGIDDPRVNKRIDFVGGLRGLDELVRRVDRGEMQVAFALYPTSMEELMQVADEDRLMPPKSTWFEPKLRSGLFIHEL